VSPPRDERAGPEPVNPFIDPRAGSILGKKRGGPGREGQAQTDRKGRGAARLDTSTPRSGELLGYVHQTVSNILSLFLIH